MNNKDVANKSGQQPPVHGSFPHSYAQPHYAYPYEQHDISRAYYYTPSQPRSDSSPYGPLPHHGAQFHPMYSHPYSGSTRSDSHSSSFESHGSSHGGRPAYVANGSGGTFMPCSSQPGDRPFSTAPSHNIHPPAMMGPSSHPPYHGHYYTHWSAPVEYITEVKSIDVLSGRGGATNSHSGNRAFRELVKKYREKYLRAKKRDKPSVAAHVVHLVRDKGGRFLQRCEILSAHGETLYYDIGDRRANEKACQALRENAPNNKRRRECSSSEDEDKHKSLESSPKVCKERKPSSPSWSSDQSPKPLKSGEVVQRDDKASGREAAREGETRVQPSCIEPSNRLMKRSQVDPIPLDKLSAEELESYLTDFLPPSLAFREGDDMSHKSIKSQTPDDDTEDGKGSPWQSVASVSSLVTYKV